MTAHWQDDAACGTASLNMDEVAQRAEAFFLGGPGAEQPA